MDKKSTILLLISLGVVAVLMAYLAGLFNWIPDYSGKVEGNRMNSVRNTVKIIALLAYAYFGVRFFSRHINSAA